MPALEVICTTVDEVQQAVAGGADSLELCVDLAQGGLTPPLSLMQAARELATCRLYVMLRPHAQSFVYDAHDRDQLLTTLATARRIGVTGVVCGGLLPDSTLDMLLMQALAAEKGELTLTMHRALDHTPDPEVALQQLVGLADRVLSSGGAEDIIAGQATMARWVQDYGALFSFVCAGGVTEANLCDVARATRAPEMHVGRAAQVGGRVSAVQVAHLKGLIATI